MAYQPTKPAANDILSVSQGDIQGNFIALGTMIDPNNINIKLPTGAAPVTNATTVGLFTAASVLSPGDTSLWFKPIAAQAPQEMTSCLKALAGWTTLPSGIIFQWGADTIANASASKQTTTSIAFPTAMVAVILSNVTPAGTGGVSTGDFILSTQIINTQNFNVTRVAPHIVPLVTYYYLAIGY